jgi:hypothetical protein
MPATYPHPRTLRSPSPAPSTLPPLTSPPLARAQKNIQATGAKVKKLIAKKDFELADYVRKKIGEVGSGKDYYQSGR